MENWTCTSYSLRRPQVIHKRGLSAVATYYWTLGWVIFNYRKKKEGGKKKKEESKKESLVQSEVRSAASKTSQQNF